MFNKLKQLGPGFLVAAAFIGPGTVTTATLAGANYGYTLLWAILFSIVATLVLQEMAARLGITAKMGLGEAIRKRAGKGISRFFLYFLVIGAVLIGNAAYEAGNISGAVMGLSPMGIEGSLPALVIGLMAFGLLWTGKYRVIETFIIFLVAVMGLVFLVSAALLKPDINAIFDGLFKVSLPENSLITVIGLIGTTVVPYNLFLHASAVREKWTGIESLRISRLDTLLSVVLGGVITMAIIMTSAVVFQGTDSGITGSIDLVNQLRPVLGSSSSVFVGAGLFAAGLSSAITAPLAAAYAARELFGWERDNRSGRFRAVWITVIAAGIIFSSIGVKPVSVILFAQATNGLLLPVISVFLLWVMNDKRIMGKYANSTLVNILAVIIILITITLGLRSLLSVFGIH